MSDFYALDADAQADRLEPLARQALTHWSGAYSDLKLVKYRENAVFSVRDAAGVRYALRVHRHGYHTDDALRSELQWMAALAAAGIDAPEVVPTAQGALWVTVAHPGIPEPRQVDMLTWLPGIPIADLEADPAQRAALHFQVGALAARIHNQGAAWALPPGFTRHAWDADGLIGPEPLWGRFRDLAALTSDDLTLIDRAVDRARGELAAFGRDERTFGLIHADFFPENLLVDGDRLRPIDFDDSGFGWRLFELATPLIAQLDEPDYPAIFDALIAGYRSVRPLDSHELAHLPLFLMLRSLTYLGWVHTRHETETARELTPVLVARAGVAVRAYLATPPLAAA